MTFPKVYFFASLRKSIMPDHRFCENCRPKSHKKIFSVLNKPGAFLCNGIHNTSFSSKQINQHIQTNHHICHFLHQLLPNVSRKYNPFYSLVQIQTFVTIQTQSSCFCYTRLFRTIPRVLKKSLSLLHFTH